MLHLDAAVQLQEPERAAVEHELRGAGAAVADRAGKGDRRLAHGGAQLRVERGGGRLLEHLLVASLDRAVALSERHDGAVRVREQLDLDVPGPFDVALAEDGAVAEGRLRLAGGRRERVVELAGRTHDPHAASAAACGGLDDERVADLVRLARGDHRHARLGRDALGRELVAAEPQRPRRWTDPGDPGGHDRVGEVRALRQEAVARMDRVGSRLACGAHVLCGVEVGRDRDGLAGRARVERAGVVGSGHRDRAPPEFVARPEDAHGDLASVRHQHLPDRAHRETLKSAGTLARPNAALTSHLRASSSPARLRPAQAPCS